MKNTKLIKMALMAACAIPTTSTYAQPPLNDLPFGVIENINKYFNFRDLLIYSQTSKENRDSTRQLVQRRLKEEWNKINEKVNTSDVENSAQFYCDLRNSFAQFNSNMELFMKSSLFDQSFLSSLFLESKTNTFFEKIYEFFKKIHEMPGSLYFASGLLEGIARNPVLTSDRFDEFLLFLEDVNKNLLSVDERLREVSLFHGDTFLIALLENPNFEPRFFGRLFQSAKHLPTERPYSLAARPSLRSEFFRSLGNCIDPAKPGYVQGLFDALQELKDSQMEKKEVIEGLLENKKITPDNFDSSLQNIVLEIINGYELQQKESLMCEFNKKFSQSKKKEDR